MSNPIIEKNRMESDVIRTETKEICGIIMPISSNDGYSAEHWNEVKNILEEVINGIGYVPNLVSDADEIGIIHNRIVTNIYNNPIVICDVSSKNPNVMFELGLRLAFDKATIIIKDNETNYNFDTAPIEHLTYPRDLRYTSINKFKSKLSDKLASTISASKDPNYSTFLKNFVQYKPKLETHEISSDKFIFKQLDEISKQLIVLQNIQISSPQQRSNYKNLVSNDMKKLIQSSIFEFLNNIGREELAKMKMGAIQNSYLDYFRNDITLFNLISENELNSYLKESFVPTILNFFEKK